MVDQATNLRKIMKSRFYDESKQINKDNAKVISISSGKGGVGKTSFAINFSISLKRLGYKVVIIDADIGLGNVEILSGTRIESTISDIVFSNKSIFDVMGTGPEGIKIISGGSGLQELKLLNSENLPKLIKEIEKLQSIVDYIIIDTGAGISNSVMDFVMTSSELIVICTPDPTSLMDSYTLIKALVLSGYTGKVNIVSNQVSGRSEGKEIFQRVFNATNNFLRVKVNYLGYINNSGLIARSAKDQIPFIISHPNNSISQRFNIMAMSFINEEALLVEDKGTNFARKLLDIFVKRGD